MTCRLVDSASRRGWEGRHAVMIGSMMAGNLGTKTDASSAVSAAASAEFAQIFAEHQSAIYGYVYRMIGNADDAADLTLTAFEKALRAWPKRPADLQVRPWLYRIATNTCLDELRHRKLIRWLSPRLHRRRRAPLPEPVAPDDPAERPAASRGCALCARRARTTSRALSDGAPPPRGRGTLLRGDRRCAGHLAQRREGPAVPGAREAQTHLHSALRRGGNLNCDRQLISAYSRRLLSPELARGDPTSTSAPATSAAGPWRRTAISGEHSPRCPPRQFRLRSASASAAHSIVGVRPQLASDLVGPFGALAAAALVFVVVASFASRPTFGHCALRRRRLSAEWGRPASFSTTRSPSSSTRRSRATPSTICRFGSNRRSRSKRRSSAAKSFFDLSFRCGPTPSTSYGSSAARRTVRANQIVTLPPPTAAPLTVNFSTGRIVAAAASATAAPHATRALPTPAPAVALVPAPQRPRSRGRGLAAGADPDRHRSPGPSAATLVSTRTPSPTSCGSYLPVESLSRFEAGRSCRRGSAARRRPSDVVTYAEETNEMASVAVDDGRNLVTLLPDGRWLAVVASPTSTPTPARPHTATPSPRRPPPGRLWKRRRRQSARLQPMSLPRRLRRPTSTTSGAAGAIGSPTLIPAPSSTATVDPTVPATRRPPNSRARFPVPSRRHRRRPARLLCQSRARPRRQRRAQPRQQSADRRSRRRRTRRSPRRRQQRPCQRQSRRQPRRQTQRAPSPPASPGYRFSNTAASCSRQPPTEASATCCSTTAPGRESPRSLRCRSPRRPPPRNAH